MRRLLLPLLLLMLSGCEEAPAEGAVKLTLTSSGFTPGCVRVIARDGSGLGEPSATEVTEKDTLADGTLTLAIFRGPGWGSTMTVEAQAFETACTSPAGPVKQRSETVTVTAGEVTELTLGFEARDGDGDGYVTRDDNGTDCADSDATRYPSAPERCDATDNDCDDQADEELGLGESCTSAGNCTGLRQCAPDGGVGCDSPAPTLVRYRDGDSDGYGAPDAGTESFCVAPTSGYATVNTDCDDGDPLRHPTASERCDGRDDNCNNTPDEGLGLGESCPPEGACTGQRACEADGGVRCEPRTFPTLQYVDDDRDRFGKADAGGMICGTPAGFATEVGDCDDGNPFTHPNARELCDQRDNNCDGNPEGAGVCPGDGGQWSAATVGTTSTFWASVSVWGDGGVWLAGPGDRRAVKRPEQTSLTLLTSNCTGDWNAVWAHPETGQAYLASAGGRLAVHSPDAGSCPTPLLLSGNEFRGLHGLTGDGGVELFPVGITSSTTGASFVWNGGATAESTRSSTHRLYAAHGSSRELLFAAGGSDTVPYVYRFDPGTGTWRDENVPTSPGGRLEGVWVVNEKLAFAVGWNSTLLVWNGTGWTRLPLTGTERLSAVLAFGYNAVYVASRDGNIYHWDGSMLHRVFQDTDREFYDIAGTSPEDIWVVGTAGRVVHWPTAP